MNDDELMTMVRESFSGVRLEIPLDETERRGRALRARRRRHGAIAGAAAAAVLVGVTTVAVTGLAGAPAPPGAVESHPPGASGRPPTGSNGTKLTAWTVKKEADGLVDVTVRQLFDPAGLERTLRADGVPTYVNFRNGLPSTSPGLPTVCKAVAISMNENANLQSKILPAAEQTYAIPNGMALVFDKRAIPTGIGIYLAIQSGSSYHEWGFSMDLVQTSVACTG